MNLFANIRQIIAGSGYESANDSRFRTHRAYGRSVDTTEDKALAPRDRQATQLECRDLWRNDPIVRGAVNRFVDYAVWKGIWPQAKTSDNKWNDQAEAWWRDIYVKTADYRQIQGVTLTSIQGLALSHRIIDGDCGFIMLENGQIQPVESARICTPQEQQKNPNVVHGIARTSKGLVTGYYICDRKDNGAVNKSKARFIPRENFIYLYNPGRFDQLRGIPDMAPAVNKIIDYGETSEYVLNKVKQDSEIITKTSTKSGVGPMRPRNHYHKTNADSKDQQRVEKTEWGRNILMRDGDDMQAFESKTPNSQYVEFMKHELQAIAACLNIPYEYLMLIFTEGSYSSQRAAMLHAQRTFDSYHDWLVTCFLDRLWNWRIAKAIKDGAIPPAPTDPDTGASQWWRKDWSLVHIDRVDPQKQVAADKERYNMCQDSLTSIVRRQGRDIDDVMREKARDIKRAEQIAIEEGVDPSKMIETGTPGLTKVTDSSQSFDNQATEGTDNI